MLIKIIKNSPPTDGSSDISKYIGQIFKAIPQGDGDISIDDESELFAMTIFKGEYKIIEEVKD